MNRPDLRRERVNPRYQDGAAGTSTEESRREGVSGLIKRYKKRRPASDKVIALGWIKATYADAIEYTGIAKETRGMGLAFGAIAGVFSSSIGLYIVYEVFDNGNWIEKLIGVAALPLTVGIGAYVILLMSRLDLFCPEDEPTVFDRKNRKVYRLSRQMPPGRAALFKRWPMSACEYDWDLIDAEHHATSTSTGSTTRTHELAMLVRSSPSDPTIVDAFRIGNAMTLWSDAMTDAVWEHIRRFMEENGPHLPSPDEPLADRTAPDSLWQSMGVTGPFGPRYAVWWRDARALTFLSHLFFPLFAPIWFIWAVFHWLSYQTAVPIAWPNEVLQAIGTANERRARET